ncbi:serine hydrolase domain-containing protein [Nocardia bovistercoris]|uniref:Beta-lactamase family protein n=1 Tax=Nocardia bovistercoris TaxID=2785916 RepID=A0A931N289_9NOCA|nr:serine hydrolase domain-containing protein [Nocardia bovistercoris]MBH0779240.1 beta-lactamase family protein [Nocardia bovistercoris]
MANEVHGTHHPRFAPVVRALEESLRTVDVGAAVAVFIDGEPVVDIWGGHTDADRTIPWRSDTIVNVFSTTKTMVAVCALILADRGDLDLNAPVATYWPEFAAAGKDGVLVRHLLGHAAGLPAWDTPVTAADLYSWPTVTTRLAEQTPSWEPGTAGGYHALTYGYLVGEVIARVTGRSVGEFFAEEVAAPLGADFHIGLPAEHDHRVATLVPDPKGDRPEGFPVGVSDANTLAWRRAQIPAVNGHGNARAVATIQSLLVCGGSVGGVRLLSPEGCARVFDEQSRGEDRILGRPIRWGLGYSLEGNTFTWGGWGGSLAFNDLDHRMSFSYVMNQMLWEDGYARSIALLMSAYESLT